MLRDLNPWRLEAVCEISRLLSQTLYDYDRPAEFVADLRELAEAIDQQHGGVLGSSDPINFDGAEIPLYPHPTSDPERNHQLLLLRWAKRHRERSLLAQHVFQLLEDLKARKLDYSRDVVQQQPPDEPS
jgi:hypothetical protein